jgi:hypothetical protein
VVPPSGVRGIACEPVAGHKTLTAF